LNGSDADRRWGRVASVPPPLSSRAPLAFWAAAAVILTVVILVGVPLPGPQDDPHPGDQRAGFLIDRDTARRVPGLKLPGAPVGRRPVVIVFDRSLPDREKLAEFLAEVPDGAAMVLVIDGGDVPADGPVPAVSDGDGSIAAAVGMPRPRDGGAPIGYAVLDGDAFVRYATLDPTYPEHGFEVDIVAGALT